MKLEGKIVNNRYKLLNLLGEGTSSFVFKARDIKSEALVALKMMKGNVTTKYIDDIIRFKREVDIVSKFSHPNIIKVIDIGDFENRPFLVTEILEGESLQESLKSKKNRSLSEILDIMRQLADALSYVHSKSIIHRDIKPGNIFLEASNGKTNVKIIDFGVSYVLEFGELNIKDEVAGTFGFMSPEATGILNRRVDERSDLYSLGVVFYTLISGETPFKGKDINKILHQQVAYEPTELHKSNKEIPITISEIVKKLMFKDPDQRYQSAAGLLTDIDKYLEGNCEFIPGKSDIKVKLTYNAGLVGRESELKVIKEKYLEAKDGRGNVILLGGEAGIGKSSIVQEVSRFVFEQKGVFLKVRCINHENKAPYQLFKDLIEEYIRYIEKSEPARQKIELEKLAKMPEGYNEILVGLNPYIEKYLGDLGKVFSLEPERENQRLLMVLSKFFLSIPSNDNTMVFFLDDLHWADDSSLKLLNEIIGSMGQQNLLILGTYRDNEIQPDHGLEIIKSQSVDKNYPLTDIHLRPLNENDSNRLIARILGEEEENEVELSNYIYNRTKGNPFFTVNLLRELVENEAVLNINGYWKIDRERIQSILISNNLIEVILKRIDNLPEEQVDLLCKAAVIGREFDVSFLRKIVNISMDKYVDMIDELISMQFLENGKEKGKLLFLHDRIREVFFQKLYSKEKIDTHLKIAKAIEEENTGDTDKVLFELVHHYVEAGDEEKLLYYLIPAADKAKCSYANDVAEKYYNIALNLIEKRNGQSKEKWIECCSSLVDVYLTMGKNDEAIEMLKKELSLIPEPLNKARAYRKIGIACFKKGDWEGCESNLSIGLNLLGERLPTRKLEWFIRLAGELIVHFFHSFTIRNYSVHEQYTYKEEDREVIRSYLTLNWMYILSDTKKLMCNIVRMLNLSESRLKGTQELGLSASAYASALMTIPFFKGAQRYQTRALSLRKAIQDEWGVAQSLQMLSFCYSWMGNHHESIKGFETARDGFLKIGDMWELGMVLSGLGYGYRYTSDYSKSIYYNEEYLDLSTRIKNTYGMISGYIELSFCYIESGVFDKAAFHINQALKLCDEYKNEYLYCCVLISKGYLELESGDAESAINYIEEAKKINENNSFLKDYTVNIYTYLTEAYLKKMEQSIKKSRMLPFEQRKLYLLCKIALKKTIFWSNHYGAALRNMAKYFVLNGKTEKAKRLLLKSIWHSNRFDRKYETAKGHYEMGKLFLISRSNDDAKHSFRNALAIFEEISSKEYVKKCILMLDEKNENITSPTNTMTRFSAERKLSTILNTSRYLSSILDLDELIEKIMDCVLEHVGAERGALFLYPEGDEKRLEVYALRNVSKDEIQSSGFKGSRSIIRKVESEKMPLIVADAMVDDSFKIESSVVVNKIRSVMCAPIMSKGSMIGVIYLDNSLVSGLFSGDDLSVLDLIASQAGVSVENARLYNKLKLYSEEIERSSNEIKMWNKTLEDRVVQRTEELEKLSNEYKSLADELNVKNIELRQMIEKLEEHAEMVEELAITKERNRFAMDVHDTLGHSMVLLIKLLEVTKMEMKTNPQNSEEKLADAISTARDGMKELKRSIYGLVPEKLEVNKFITALKKLIDDFKVSGVNIELKVDSIYDYRNPAYSYTLFKACQEALTNSVRHGKAKNISVDIKFIDNIISLIICDDGVGCSNVRKGFGIMGIEERIKELKGRVSYYSEKDKGFKLDIELPLEV